MTHFATEIENMVDLSIVFDCGEILNTYTKKFRKYLL